MGYTRTSYVQNYCAINLLFYQSKLATTWSTELAKLFILDLYFDEDLPFCI